MSGLESELVVLGARLDAPAGEALAARVATALVQPHAPRRFRRRFGLVAAALIVAAGGAYSSVPAIAEWFGVRGVSILQQAPPQELDRYGLGARVSRHHARSAAGFDLLVPARLGPPGEVRVDDSASAPLVWFVYPDALLMQAKVTVADELLATKFADPGTTVAAVAVGTGPAFWIQGAHFVAFLGRQGEVIVDRMHRSGNVLLWQHGDVTLRLEGSFDLATALDIANSTR